MFNLLRREFMLVNILLIFIIVCSALLVFYLVTWFNTEQNITKSISSYLSTPIDQIRADKENPRLFISDIDAATYEYIQPLIDSNIFKYFHTAYAHDSFSSSQTNDILSRVVTSSEFVSNIEVGGRQYKFLKHNTDDEMIKIAVLDITKYKNNLRSTGLILITIAIMSLILIFFVSKIITELSIKPIERMFRRQNEFFSDIAHELKTPLTVAITNLAVVESHRHESVASQEKWLGYLKDQLHRLSTLVNEMLFLEDVQSGKALGNGAHIDFSELVDNHLKSVAPLLAKKDIILSTAIEEKIHVFADREAMIRLVGILVDNAIKYTPNSGSISMHVTKRGKRVLLAIKNSGMGIAPEHVGRIFDRMYRVSESRSRHEGGEGLGLAIAKSVVEKYGGNIEVESEVGEFTSFSVTLPIIL